MSKNQFHSCASYSDSGGESESSSKPKPPISISELREVKSTKRYLVSHRESTSSNRSRQSISVLGMGERGFNLSARLSSQSFGVIAVDSMKSIVTKILQADAYAFPARYREQLVNNRKRKSLSATTELQTAVKCSSVTFITPDIYQNSKSRGKQSKQAIEAMADIGKAIRNKTESHLVVFYDFEDFSWMEKSLISTIEEKSKKKCGKGFGACGVIEHPGNTNQYATAYIRGFDPASELSIRRIYKCIGSVNTVFDY